MPFAHAEAQRSENLGSNNALRRILDTAPHQHKLQILDLGPPRQAKFEMLRKMAPCCIHVRDISELCLEKKPVKSNIKSRDCFQELNFDTKLRFDVVFAWDILNYLDRQRLVGLISHVGGYCREGALLHALLATTESIPSQPHQFDIENNNRIVFYPKRHTDTTISGPGYPPAEFQSLLPRFQVMHMFQLPNRYQEHLYSFDSFKPYRHKQFS